MARYRKPKIKGESHVGMSRRVYFNKLFDGLSPGAKIFYWYLKSRFDGVNNGDIKLPYSVMRNVLGCTNSKTTKAAIDELESKGWIKIRKKGGLLYYSNYYKLTFKHEQYGDPDTKEDKLDIMKKRAKK